MDSGCRKELFYSRTLGVEDVAVTEDIQIAVNHEFTIGRLTIDNIGCMNLFYPIYLRVRFTLSLQIYATDSKFGTRPLAHYTQNIRLRDIAIWSLRGKIHFYYVRFVIYGIQKEIDIPLSIYVPRMVTILQEDCKFESLSGTTVHVRYNYNDF